MVIDNAFFAESKNAGGAPSGGSRYDSQIPQYSETPPAFSTANAGDFDEIVGDDDFAVLNALEKEANAHGF